MEGVLDLLAEREGFGARASGGWALHEADPAACSGGGFGGRVRVREDVYEREERDAGMEWTEQH
jgi:hypothetical protein